MKKTITIHIDDEPREITLGSARKEDGIRRAELMMASFQVEGTQARKQAAFFLYPNCVCSVREPEDVKYMSLDDFLSKVDEADIDTWMADAYELNPQWRTALDALKNLSEEEAAQKNGMASTGSSPSTETQERSSETSPISTT